MIRKTSVLILSLVLLASCGTSRALPKNFVDTIHRTCDLYQKNRPRAIAIRTEIAKKIDSFPASVQDDLRAFDEQLPKIDAAGAAVCAADAVIENGTAPDWLAQIPWEKLIPLVLKLAIGA